ncbi:cellulose biosynthesis protein BcsP [Paraburkholderia dilworthii]|uniref:cellulose biosynthesis protein BcsP n=1 Tax=Paraburkholderia dilworthii TaxID=948106 RepID=UPI000486614D|nr:cellulose biosynthesis protein BcsP [Paraburkholderia dilworthii]
MSSSSDIEKLFDHFGGDANAYQEIGRENEAHSARTRWPLLVTLDLKQPPIPAIGQRALAKPQAVADEAASVTGERQDIAAPKDAASVTRAKAPLFTRSHRRDIPPVAVAAPPPAMPRGASRFGAVETDNAAGKVGATVPPATPTASAIAAASIAPVVEARTPAAATARAQAPTTVRIPPGAAATHQVTPTSTPARPAMPTEHVTPAPTATATPAQQPTSILGKLFAPQVPPAPPRTSAPVTQPVPLQSLFDRLRGTAAASAGAAGHAAPHSWLVNGPRRS